MNIPQFILSFIVLVVIATCTVIITRRRRKSWTSRLIAILAAEVSIYIIALYFSLNNPPLVGLDGQLFLIRSVMAAVSTFGATFVVLAWVFPGDNLNLPKKYLYPIVAVCLFAFVSSLTPFVYKAIVFKQGEVEPVPGIGYNIWGIMMSVSVLSSLVISVVKFLKAPISEKATQLFFLLSEATAYIMSITAGYYAALLGSSITVSLGPLPWIFFFIPVAFILGRIHNQSTVQEPMRDIFSKTIQ